MKHVHWQWHLFLPELCKQWRGGLTIIAQDKQSNLLAHLCWHWSFWRGLRPTRHRGWAPSRTRRRSLIGRSWQLCRCAPAPRRTPSVAPPPHHPPLVSSPPSLLPPLSWWVVHPSTSPGRQTGAAPTTGTWRSESKEENDKNILKYFIDNCKKTVFLQHQNTLKSIRRQGIWYMKESVQQIKWPGTVK